MTTTASPPGLASPISSNRRKRFLDHPIRNSLLALSSFLVLFLVALFLFAAPGSATVTFSVQVSPINSHNVVVYGKVRTVSLRGVANARVKIFRIENGRTHVLRVVTTTKKGIYRMVFRHFTHRVKLYEKISVKHRGTRYHGTTKFYVHRGHAYKVSAQLARRGSFFFFPIYTY